MSRLLAVVKATLWKVIRSKEVRPFVWVYYIPLFTWGIIGTFFAGPVTYVLPVMGPAAYDAWIWLHLVGTVTVMAGMLAEDKGGRLGRVALPLQAGGHACMFWVLLSYEVSASAVAFWRDAAHSSLVTYSIFVIVPYVGGCLLLTAQSIALMADEKKDSPPAPPEGEL
jgi:hypothetical protein